MEIEQLLTGACGACECKNEYSIEPHGDAWALYFGRCDHRHGYNLARISEISYNCELKEIERLLNRAEIEKRMGPGG